VLKIHETYGETEALTSVYLAMHDKELVLAVHNDGQETETALPLRLLIAVFERYARPLEKGTVLSGPILALGQGTSVQHLRHLSGFDALSVG
jgi:hypothetical protein